MYVGNYDFWNDNEIINEKIMMQMIIQTKIYNQMNCLKLIVDELIYVK